jgi:LAS superfamily LD-carboxypeptidase LdcB
LLRVLSPFELTGRVRTHVTQHAEPRFAAQPLVVQAFLDMRSAAARDGFDLVPFSSFRDFSTQVKIWNAKFRGEKPLYDAAGIPRDHAALGPMELVWSIMEWSALPGASRHHWGTEIDVVDKASMPQGYKVRLLPAEVVTGGIFRPLHDWLDANMARFGFFRPYDVERGGMHPEPWHLSFGELSRPALTAFSEDIARRALEECEIEGQDLVLGSLNEIFARHVRNIAYGP